MAGVNSPPVSPGVLKEGSKQYPSLWYCEASKGSFQ